MPTFYSRDALTPPCAAFSSGAHRIAIHRADYEANAPTEDRHTIVVEQGDAPLVFVGVYDGHGGGKCSTHVEKHMHGLFSAALSEDGVDAAAAAKGALVACDEAYIESGKNERDR